MAYTCKRCDKPFELPPKRRKPGRGVYCSIICKRANHAGATNPNWRGGVGRCAYCKGPTKRRGKRYCSVACYQSTPEALAHCRAVAHMGFRRGCRTDANQAEIVDALKSAGADVFDASPMGEGFPDLIVGFRRSNFLLEVKNPNSGYGKSKLSGRQKEFFDTWRGQANVVRTPEEALQAIGALK